MQLLQEYLFLNSETQITNEKVSYGEMLLMPEPLVVDVTQLGCEQTFPSSSVHM